MRKKLLILMTLVAVLTALHPSGHQARVKDDGSGYSAVFRVNADCSSNWAGSAHSIPTPTGRCEHRYLQQTIDEAKTTIRRAPRSNPTRR